MARTRNNPKTQVQAEVKLSWVVGTGDAWTALKARCAELSAEHGSKATFVMSKPVAWDGSPTTLAKVQAEATQARDSVAWVGGIVGKLSATAIGYWAVPMSDEQKAVKKANAAERKADKKALAQTASSSAPKSDKPAAETVPAKANERSTAKKSNTQDAQAQESVDRQFPTKAMREAAKTRIKPAPAAAEPTSMNERMAALEANFAKLFGMIEGMAKNA